MKLIIALFLCSIAPFQLVESPLVHLIKSHAQRFEGKSTKNWMLDSCILSSDILLDFPVDAQKDTIYFTTCRSGGVEYNSIWKPHYKYEISLWPKKVEKKYIPTFVSTNNTEKIERVSTGRLIANWECDLLRYLGEKVEKEEFVADIDRYRLTRIIFDKGREKIDTVKYTNPKYILQYLTIEQVDSIRKIVNDSIKLVKDSISKIPATVTSDNQEIQETIAIEPAHPITKSLWQRFIDWICNLWYSIFG